MTAVERYVELLDRILSGEIAPPKKYPASYLITIARDWGLIDDIGEEDLKVASYVDDVWTYHFEGATPLDRFYEQIREMRTKILEIQKSTADCEREENLNDRN